MPTPAERELISDEEIRAALEAVERGDFAQPESAETEATPEQVAEPSRHEVETSPAAVPESVPTAEPASVEQAARRSDDQPLDDELAGVLAAVEQLEQSLGIAAPQAELDASGGRIAPPLPESTPPSPGPPETDPTAVGPTEPAVPAEASEAAPDPEPAVQPEARPVAHAEPAATSPAPDSSDRGAASASAAADPQAADAPPQVSGSPAAQPPPPQAKVRFKIGPVAPPAEQPASPEGRSEQLPQPPSDASTEPKPDSTGSPSAQQQSRLAKSEDTAAASAPVPPKPGLWKRIYRFFDEILEAINRPFLWLSPSVREVLGYASLASIGVSLAWLLLTPLLTSRTDAIAYVQLKRRELEAARAAQPVARGAARPAAASAPAGVDILQADAAPQPPVENAD